MRWQRRRTTGDERGLLSTELAILMPVLFVIALLAVFVVHVGRHSSRAQQAADAAARAASLSLNEDDAQSAALRAAQDTCGGEATISSFDYHRPVLDSYEPGRVVVVVACTEEFSAFAGLSGESMRTESAQGVAVVEYWRPG